ncbi:MAG: hypothetical protein KKD17_00345 [Nanoarchaeota archaeon]|nr:hypothetical protein [Nanoarchaeota archaeon]
MFEDFIAEGKVMVGSKDKQKAKALLASSENNLKAIDMLELNEVTSSTILSASYESLRQVLEALCLSEGYKVYSHEAFTQYLLKIHEEAAAERFDRLRKLRNGVNYYGKQVPVGVALDAKKQIKELCAALKKKYV